MYSNLLQPTYQYPNQSYQPARNKQSIFSVGELEDFNFEVSSLQSADP